MKTLHLFYDAGCGLCRKLRDQFENEPADLILHFVAYQSMEANELVPNLASYHPEKGILALTPEGRILQGVDSWLAMLVSTKRFRLFARVIGSSLWRPITKWAYELTARNRHPLSRLIGFKNLTLEELKCERCAW